MLRWGNKLQFIRKEHSKDHSHQHVRGVGYCIQFKLEHNEIFVIRCNRLVSEQSFVGNSLEHSKQMPYRK